MMNEANVVARQYSTSTRKTTAVDGRFIDPLTVHLVALTHFRVTELGVVNFDSRPLVNARSAKCVGCKMVMELKKVNKV